MIAHQFIKGKALSKRAKENERLLLGIKRSYENSRKTYGSPRIHAELREEGEICSRKRVAKLMKKAGIEAKMKKKFKVTTRVNPKEKTAPNRLEQDFTAKAKSALGCRYNVCCYIRRLALCCCCFRFIFTANCWTCNE